jgi:hypothetical protein
VVTDSKGTQHPVAISAIKSASLADLCQSVSVGRSRCGSPLAAGTRLPRRAT